MKVAIFSVFDKEDQGGGESRMVFETAEQLISNGHEVILFCPGDETGPIFSKSLQKFTLKSLGESPGRFSLFTTSHIDKIIEVLEDFSPDVIHSHTMSIIGLIGQLWAIRNSVPFLYTAHVTPDDVIKFVRTRRLYDNLISRSFVKIYTDQFLKNCTAIIALNSHIAEKFKADFPENDVYLIPNGRDLKPYFDLKISDITDAQKNLIFIGTIYKRKNEELLVKTMKYLPKDYSLTLLGEIGDEAYYRKIQKIIEENNLSSIKFPGKVKYSEVRSYLEESHLFINASKNESFGLAILESLASGTPVMTLEEENILAWIPKQVKVVNKKIKPQVLAQEIIEFFEIDNSKYKKLAEDGRKSVEVYDWSNVILNLVKCYEEVLIKKKSGVANPKDKNILLKSLSFLEDIKLQDYIKDKLFTPSTKKEKKKKDLITRKTKILFLIGASASITGYLALKAINNIKKSKVD